MNNNGPNEKITGAHVGPAQANTIKYRRAKRHGAINLSEESGGVVTAFEQ